MGGCPSLSNIKPLKILGIPMFNEHLDLNKIKYLKNVANDSFVYFTLDNTFIVFE